MNEENNKTLNSVKKLSETIHRLQIVLKEILFEWMNRIIYIKKK